MRKKLTENYNKDSYIKESLDLEEDFRKEYKNKFKKIDELLRIQDVYLDTELLQLPSIKRWYESQCVNSVRDFSSSEKALLNILKASRTKITPQLKDPGLFYKLYETVERLCNYIHQ